MNKKPKVFENKISKVINNNQELFDSSKDNILKIEDVNTNEPQLEENFSVMDKLNSLLNQNGYIFNKEVIIKTINKEYKTHIASIISNHIITLDNDIINLEDVIDIIY